MDSRVEGKNTHDITLHSVTNTGKLILEQIYIFIINMNIFLLQYFKYF